MLLAPLGLTVLSCVVANAIPFFKHLVSLTGALTSVALTLSLPAMYYRKAFRIVWPSCPWSFGLLVFAIAFAVAGRVGVPSQIQVDWEHQERSFECH
jgi:hypothetical protein